MFNGYDSDLEREVIGCMLNHYTDMLLCVTDLDERDFGSLEYKKIFNSIKDVSSKSQNLPTVGEIVFHQQSAKDGLLELLISMKESNAGLDIRYLLALMFALREVRKISALSDNFKKRMKDLKRDQYHQFVKESHEEVFSQLRYDGIRNESTLKSYIDQQTVYNQALENQTARLEGRSVFHGIPTRYVDLDNKIYGFAKGHLIIIGGRPGQGKTSFLLNLATNMKESKVAIFSLEMTSDELAAKLVLKEADVKYSAYSKGEITNIDVNKIYGAQKLLDDRSIVIDDMGGLSPSALYAKLLRFQKLYGVDIVFIDYLQLMNGNERTYENNQVKISSISHALKQIAKECNVPVVALAQLNRSVEQREAAAPRMSDLRESGAIEADADVILLLNRPMNGTIQKKPGVLDVVIAKNRFGETGTIELNFNMATGRISNLAKQDIGAFAQFSSDS